jgi:hypothetical protein
MTDPVPTLFRVGLLNPELFAAAYLVAEGWCWAADYHLWNTDFVGFRIGAAPASLCALLDALGTGHLLNDYRAR